MKPVTQPAMPVTQPAMLAMQPQMLAILLQIPAKTLAKQLQLPEMMIANVLKHPWVVLLQPPEVSEKPVMPEMELTAEMYHQSRSRARPRSRRATR